MQYNAPPGSADPNTGYTTGIPGVKRGSPVPGEAIEQPQRELVAVIEEAARQGLDIAPSGGDLTQVIQSVLYLIQKNMPAVPDKYDLCEFYYFRHPTLKTGFLPAQGGLVENAAKQYPAAWEYLKSLEGQKLCKTESEWQTMTTATWHTNADATKVGWNGIGGAPFYAPDWNTGALRLPDLRGMYAEAAGFDSLGVGGVHGDAVRNITGIAGYFNDCYGVKSEGALQVVGVASGGHQNSVGNKHQIVLDPSRVVPVAAKNQPRAWGALACVYLGAPR